MQLYIYVIQHGRKLNEDRLKLTKIGDTLAYYYSSRAIEAETKKRKKKKKKEKQKWERICNQPKLRICSRRSREENNRLDCPSNLVRRRG